MRLILYELYQETNWPYNFIYRFYVNFEVAVICVILLTGQDMCDIPVSYTHLTLPTILLV